MAEGLQTAYPWTSKPLICNAPMRGFAGPAMASEVTKAGGIGFIGATFSMQDLSSKLDEVRGLLPNVAAPGGKIPIGVGLLTFGVNRSEALPVFQKHKPAIVWLFAANATEDYAAWVHEIRSVCSADIWIQTGSVADALILARSCQPNVLVLQGADAGGHGPEKGAGVISLLPETADALANEGFGTIPLIAAGGIADGRGCAAALALGAAGVVMGTRFLASKEVVIPHHGYADAVLSASDGGQATVRSKIFDELNAKGNIWPTLYDGRALRNLTYRDLLEGLGLEEIRRLHREAAAGSDGGFWKGEKRVTIWAGTGVGLVKELKPAGQIVEETRNEVQQRIKGLQAKI